MPVLPLDCHLPTQYTTHTITLQQWTNNKTNKSYKQLIYIYISHVNVTQTVPDISPLMPMHQDPWLVHLVGYHSLNTFSGLIRDEKMSCCPACRTTLVATRFRVAVICPIIQVPHCIRVFFYFVWFVFINHIFQFYYELCTYCNILDIYLS